MADVSIFVALEGIAEVSEGLTSVTNQIAKMGAISHETAEKLAAPFESLNRWLGIIKTALVATGIAEFAAGFLEAGVAADDMRMKFNLLTGSLEKGGEAMEVVEKFVLRTGISMHEVGIAAQQLLRVPGTMEDLNKRLSETAALAAITGRSFDDMGFLLTRAFTSGSVGARMMLRQGLGAMLDLQNGVKYSAEQMQQHIDKALNDPAKTFSIATEYMATSWTALTGQLTARWEAFQEMVMNSGLLDFLKAGLTTVRQYIDGMSGGAAGFAQVLSGLVVEGFKNVIMAAATLIDQLTIAFNLVKQITDLLPHLALPKTWEEFVMGIPGANEQRDLENLNIEIEALQKNLKILQDAPLNDTNHKEITDLENDIDKLQEKAEKVQTSLAKINEQHPQPGNTAVSLASQAVARLELNQEIAAEGADKLFENIKHGAAGVQNDLSGANKAFDKLKSDIQEMIKQTEDPFVKLNKQIAELKQGMTTIDPATGKALVTLDQYNKAVVVLTEAAEKAQAALMGLNEELDKEKTLHDQAKAAIEAQLEPLEKYRLELEKLTKVQPGMEGVGTTADYMNSKQMQRSTDALNKQLADQAIQFSQDTTPAMIAYRDQLRGLTADVYSGAISWDDYVKGVKAAQLQMTTLQTVTQDFQSIAEDAFSSVGDAIVASLQGTATGWDAFKQIGISAIQAVLKELIKLTLINPILNALTGATGGTGTLPTLGSLLGFLGGGSSGSATGAGGASAMFGAPAASSGLLGLGFLGLAAGGEFTATAPRLIMVGEGGQPEDVSVRPAGMGRQSGGGVTMIHMDLRGSNGDASIQAAVQRGIRAAAPQLVNTAVTTTQQRRQRNPRFFGPRASR